MVLIGLVLVCQNVVCLRVKCIFCVGLYLACMSRPILWALSVSQILDVLLSDGNLVADERLSFKVKHVKPRYILQKNVKTA